MKLSELDASETKPLKLSQVAGEVASPEVPAPVTDQKPKKPSYDLLGGAAEVGKATGLGAVAGALAPELISLTGMGMMAFPLTTLAGPPVIAAGRAMRGARMASAVSGALGGLAGETAGQAVEAAGGGKTAAEAARFGVGMVGPEAARTVTKPLTAAGGYAVSQLINKFLPGIGTGARTIGQLIGERGIAEVKPTLTQAQTQFIEDKIKSIRGGAESFQPMRDIMGVLRQAAGQAQQKAETEAAALEQQAASLLTQAQAAGGRITAEAEQRVSRLQSQLNSSADTIRTSAEQQAKTIRGQAELAAEAVRQRAATQAPKMREAAEAEAEAVIASGREQADRLLADSKARASRLQSTADKLRASVPQRAEAAASEIAQVGERIKPTDLGEAIRKKFTDAFDKLKATREKNVAELKTKAFADALGKEQTGRTFRETQGYQEAVTGLSREIQNPETKLLNVPEGAVREQLVKVLTQLQQDQLSFQGLEVLRRSLRDRASGLPAEGFDAIGQQQAGRIADYVEKIQRDFSPGFGKYLEQYRIDSKPLNEFKNKLGQSMVGRAEFDFGQFAADPAALGPQAFKSASTVNQVIQVAGQQEAERFARSFIADKIRGGKAADIKKAIDDSRDWIGSFPGLAAQLNQAAERVGIAERVGAKRSELAKTLRTEMRGIPGVTERAMTRVEEDAARAAAAGLKKREAEVGKVMTGAETEAARTLREAEQKAAGVTTAAEQQIAQSSKAVERQRERIAGEAQKAAGAEMTAAETAAAGLTKEAQAARAKAQDEVKLLLAGKTDVERVRDFLLGAKADEWAAISPIIKAAPGGREKLAEAVGQVIANRANQSLKGAINDMRLMGEKLVDNGLMSRADADTLIAKLQEVFVAPMDVSTRSTAAQRLIRNAMASYAVPGVERGVEGVVNLTKGE